MSNDEIKDLFETLGVTRRYIGYYFLLDAVEIINRDETTLLKVGEYIYEPIAKKYNCNTATVERNIRTVILHIWKNNKRQVEKIMLQQYLPCRSLLTILLTISVKARANQTTYNIYNA